MQCFNVFHSFWKGRVTIPSGASADETASVHFQLWGDECNTFHTGDIVHLYNGIFAYNSNNLVLRAGK
ncbi:hypothetical protein Leryth_002179 [Lithospermum erythrorhizon]|nr:hypothetical protein Leryth_002179 [Lithospermum erythrorhizon]